MDETGLPRAGGGGDQSIGEGEPLRSLAAKIKGGQGGRFIDGNNLVQQLAVACDGLAGLLDRSSQLAHPSGKLRQGDARGQNLGLGLLEKRLHSSPTRLSPPMGDQG